MLNKEKHKLDWLKTRKQNTQVIQNQKQEGEREKKWLNHLEPFSFHTFEELLCFANPWFGSEGEELKLFKFERNMRVLSKSPKGSKEDGNWF